MAKTENAVVPWDQELAKFAQAAAAVEAPAVSYLNFRNGVLKYQDTPIPGNALNVVVVGQVFENAYYEGRFDPTAPANPVCFAIAEVEDELEPAEGATKKQHDTCAGCPKLEWGSNPTGAGKACKQIRRLAVIPATELETPEKIAKAEVAIAKLPVTSVKNWSNYVNSIASTVRRPPFAVITQLKVEVDPKTQFKVKFAHMANLSEEASKAVYARREEVTKMLNVPYAPSENAPAPNLSKKM
jgi:hypothetical protein